MWDGWGSTVVASSTMAIGFLCPHFGVSAVVSHQGDKSSSMMKQGQRLHAAQSGESSSPDPVLNIVINCMKKPNKNKKFFLLNVLNSLSQCCSRSVVKLC